MPSTQPPAEWPSKGEISFEGCVLRYDPRLPPALRGLTLRVAGGERLGIVGRTGAGKSTIAVALFRFVELEAGRVLLDGLDTATLGTDAVRSALAIIPQEALLFAGDVRHNLDPDRRAPDAAVWRALEQVQLAGVIESLSAPVTENGANLSQGQRQLICLARALIRQPKCLVMDEATASIDEQTDERVQEAIRAGFSCTTLCIAHRLRTVEDFNRLAMLDAGVLAACRPPSELIERGNGGRLQLKAPGDVRDPDAGRGAGGAP